MGFNIINLYSYRSLYIYHLNQTKKFRKELIILDMEKNKKA